jgi:hypothetical protein
MTKNFYVLDGDGNTVWQGEERDDRPQSFAKFDAAEKRAMAFAKTVPGEEIKVVGVLAVVKCDVSAPKSRKS